VPPLRSQGPRAVEDSARAVEETPEDGGRLRSVARTDRPEGARTSPGGAGFRLGEWLVLPSLNVVEGPGESRRLEPKVMDVLCFLADEPGRVRSKEEILDAVWPGVHVTESVLTRAVAEIRKALGDDAAKPRYIDTVPRRGYRLVAPVEAESAGRPPHSAGGRPARRWLLGVLVAALALVDVLGVTGRFSGRSDRGASEGPGAATEDAVPRLSQVTAAAGTETFPAFFPDGRSLVYSSDATGRFELYLTHLAEGGRPRSLTSDGRDNVQPAVSPDGRWVAYHAAAPDGIWLVPALGGEPRQVVGFGADPVWAPDGGRIVFQSGGVSAVSLDTFPAFPPSTLWQVAVEEGRTVSEPEPLTRPGEPFGGHGSPAVSPDGRWVAFTAFDLGSSGLWVMPSTGGPARSVPGVTKPFDPVFAPDGRSLFVAEGTAESHLVRVPFDPERGEATGPPVMVTQIDGRHLSVSAVGAEGTGLLLAVGRLEMTSDLWTVPVDPETGEPAGPEQPLTHDTSRRTSTPAFSPDGREIAYSLVRAGLDPEIWAMAADGTGARPLTGPTPGVFLPRWLRDGRGVAFTAVETDGGGYRRVLRVVDPETRRSEELARLGADWHVPRVDPAGTRLAFHRSRGEERAGVWVWTIGEDRPKRVTDEPGFVGFPSWSPDGRLLSVELMEAAASHVGVVPVAGGPVRRLTEEPGHSWAWAWSPDGSKVLFSGLRDGRWNLYWVPVEGGPERRITGHGASLSSFVRYPDWSPAGDRIVYERRQTVGDVWLVRLGR